VKLKTLDEAIGDHGIKCLVIGFAGSGKTRLLSTLPGKGLVVSAEAGLRSLRKAEMAGKFDIAEIFSIDELRQAWAIAAKPNHGYDWVALDSISEIAEQVLAHEKKQTKDPRKAYGALIDEMLQVLKSFRDLPLVDVYFSAKAMSVVEEDTGRVLTQILIPGAKLAQHIPYLFDEVFQLVVKEDKASGDVTRWFQTRRDSKCDCKDRSGELAPFEPADLGAVFAKIRGNQTNNSAEAQAQQGVAQ
jgi:hypothetical protein